MKARALCYATLVAAVVVMISVSQVLAGWSWWNFGGVGKATVSVNALTFTDPPGLLPIPLASARIPGPVPGWPNGVGLPPGAKLGTWSEARLTLLPFPLGLGGWGNCRARGGDACDSADLEPYVTPVSSLAETSLNIELSDISEDLTEASFSGHWAGTDEGTAQRLQWYQYTGTIPEDFEGDYTDLPDWDTLSSFLREELRVGPWDEDIDFTVSGSELAVENMVLVSDGIATSLVPEPTALALSCMALLGAIKFRRRWRCAHAKRHTASYSDELEAQPW